MRRRIQHSAESYARKRSNVLAYTFVGTVIAGLAIALIAAQRARSVVPPELIDTWDLETRTSAAQPNAWEFAPNNTVLLYGQDLTTGTYYVVDRDTIAVTYHCPNSGFSIPSRRNKKPECPTAMFDFRVVEDMLYLTRAQDAAAPTETYLHRLRR